MFRNWKELCKVGMESQALMTALLTLDDDSGLGRSLREAFPECWSSVETEGPVPFSHLVRLHIESDCGAEYLGSEPYQFNPDGSKAHGICLTQREFLDVPLPVIEFTSELPKFPYLTTDDGVEFPRELFESCYFKQVVGWNNKNWVVLYFAKSLRGEESLTLAPLECVALEL